MDIRVREQHVSILFILQHKMQINYAGRSQHDDGTAEHIGTDNGQQ